MKKSATVLPSWRIFQEAHSDFNFIVSDHQHIAFDANPKWIVETGAGFCGLAIIFASLLAMMGRTADAGGVITVDVRETTELKRSNPQVASRHFLLERNDFLMAPDYIFTGISNFPDSILRKKG